VFDKLKNLLGTQPQDPTAGAQARPSRSTTGGGAGGGGGGGGPGGGARRPARLRSPLSQPGLVAGARARRPSGAFDPLGPADEEAPAEIPCPNCGEPMLTGWGTTCGKCRPNLVGAKTMFFAPGQVELPAQAAGGMTLGWLIVVRTGEESKKGQLIELDSDTLVLSRADAPPTGAAKLVAFDDGFMSSGHAVLGRPLTGERTDAFTIRDRDRPGPSANGTFVNSHKLVKGEIVRLADGDIIKVGTTELLFKSLWLPPVGTRTP
jgi:hypothetical protein